MIKELRGQKDKRSEEKTMNADENVFYEATLRTFSSLNLVTALESCFDYVKLCIPTNSIFNIMGYILLSQGTQT